MAKRRETRAQVIGRVLDELRVGQGLSRAELARRCDMLPQNLGTILDGLRHGRRDQGPAESVTAGTLVRIAGALGTTAEVILRSAGEGGVAPEQVALMPADAAAAVADALGVPIAEACGLA